MVYKAGATYQKEIREFFDENNYDHVWAFVLYEATGKWPSGFVTNDVWFKDQTWLDEIRGRVHHCALPAQVQKMLKEFNRVLRIVDLLAYPRCDFVIEPLGLGYFVLYAEYTAHNGKVSKGRAWAIKHDETRFEIVRTAFRAVVDHMEREVRQHFKYDDRAVFAECCLDVDVMAEDDAIKAGKGEL